MPRANKGLREYPSKRKRADMIDNPELPKRANVEVIRSLYLKNDPAIVDGILDLMGTAGYKTVPETVRHLLAVALAVTPVDGEVRAAIQSVKSEMNKYCGKLFWGKMAELLEQFEREWTHQIVLEKIEQEIERIRAEKGIQNVG